MNREELINRATERHHIAAMRALVGIATDEEIKQWDNRDVWASVADRWRRQGHTPATAKQYYYMVCITLGLSKPRNKAAKKGKPTCKKCGKVGHHERNCATPPGKFCSQCYDLPHHRPKDQLCRCGKPYIDDGE